MHTSDLSSINFLWSLYYRFHLSNLSLKTERQIPTGLWRWSFVDRVKPQRSATWFMEPLRVLVSCVCQAACPSRPVRLTAGVYLCGARVKEFQLVFLQIQSHFYYLLVQAFIAFWTQHILIAQNSGGENLELQFSTFGEKTLANANLVVLTGNFGESYFVPIVWVIVLVVTNPRQ